MFNLIYLVYFLYQSASDAALFMNLNLENNNTGS